MPARSHRLLFLCYHLRYGLCLPQAAQGASSPTKSSYVGYVDDPAGRGTSSLILSCLLTLVLCVWSALHLNVPPPGRGRRQTFWTNVIWITAGIYAPEMVVFTAWRQWSSAKLLYKRIHQHRPKSDVMAKHPWTMTHSFFACTGGFALDCSPYIAGPHNPEAILPPNAPKRLTITARGMAFLASCGHVPDISREDILDKSKADTLAKTLVMIQASWMLLQVIARLVVGLPVTLLEVNTVAHVLCALSMYAMWWSKPLNSKEPFLFGGPWLSQLLPYMYMSSEVSGMIDEKHVKSQTMVKTLFAYMNLYSKTPEIAFVCLRPVSEDILEHDSTAQHEVEPHDNLAATHDTRLQCLLRDSVCKSNSKGADARNKEESAFFERRPRVRVATSKYFGADQNVALCRERLASAALQYIDVADEMPYESKPSTGSTCLHLEPSELLVECSRNWPSDELLRDVNGLIVGMILWLANLLYGGIHLAAWNDHFPSAVEKWLWRSSAAYIGFCGGLWVILNWIVSKWTRLNAFWERWMEGKKSWYHNLVLGFLVVLCGFSLMLARAYIVVEAFLSIRQLPKKAYETPSWSQVWPHF